MTKEQITSLEERAMKAVDDLEFKEKESRINTVFEDMKTHFPELERRGDFLVLDNDVFVPEISSRNHMRGNFGSVYDLVSYGRYIRERIRCAQKPKPSFLERVKEWWNPSIRY